jgi:aarF domain-containing kinase
VAAVPKRFVSVDPAITVPAFPQPRSLPFPRLQIFGKRGFSSAAASAETPAQQALRRQFRACAVRIVAALASGRPLSTAHATRLPTRLFSSAAAAGLAPTPKEISGQQQQQSPQQQEHEDTSSASPADSKTSDNPGGSSSSGSSSGGKHRYVPPPPGRFRWGLFWVANGIIGTFLAMSVADIIWDFGFMNPGVHRSLYFWAHALPIWLAYRSVKVSYDIRGAVSDWADAHPDGYAAVLLQPLCLPGGMSREDAAQEAYDVLNRRFATTIYDVIVRLRGYYIKLGQVGSLRPDVLPEAWVDELAKLQDAAPAESFANIRAVVEAELGAPLEEAFLSFEATPLGSASVAQVHRATLKDGREVAVKVQFPGVESVFAADMSAVRLFVRFAQPEHLVFLDEIERQFMTEFDFEREAAFLSVFSEALDRSPFRKQVVVPKPVPELTTRNVLTMEFLSGEKLVTALRRLHERIAGDEGLTLKELTERNKHAKALSNAQVRIYSSIFYASDALANSARFLFNWTAGWFVPPLGYKHRTPPIAVPRLIDTLLDVHAFQLFDIGAFNGDPHPGNLMLLDDARMGLIDFGQVKTLGMLERAVIGRLFDALDRGDRTESVRWYKAMGHRSERDDHDVLFELARLGYDYDDAQTRGGRNVQLYFEHLMERDKLTMGNDMWVLPSRMLILLRGLASALHYDVHAAKPFAHAGRRFLEENPAWRLASDCALEYSESPWAETRSDKYWNDLTEFVADKLINDQRFQQFGFVVTKGEEVVGATNAAEQAQAAAAGVAADK